jgi:hypothetical protein
VKGATVTSNIGHEPMISKRAHREPRTATRFSVNPNWNRRGDNTKYKEKT